MKRIILSLLTLGLVGVVATGATTALFSDEETSTGNTFTAGAIDLQIDNESYYNGEPRPDLTWALADLDDGNGPVAGAYLFFDYADLKPGDWGEDTISIHVDNNESWLCADVTLTSNDDNGITEPEGKDGDNTDGAGEGELADAVNFFWWADDGDNVYEDNETLLPAGPLGALAVGETATVALADSQTNIWDGNGPFPGDSVRYIGKAWCFGDSSFDPYTQDGLGKGNNNSPVERPVLCNGAPVNNVTQTDSMTADIAFRAVQSRNNPNFICLPPDQSTLTVRKAVSGGTIPAEDFDLFVNGSPVVSAETNVYPAEILLTVTETPVDGYVASFDGDCDANGEITLDPGQDAICIITNTFDPDGANITVTKVVNGGPLVAADFDLFVDAEPVVNGVPEFFAPGLHNVSEVDDSGLYTMTYTGLDDCDANGDLTLVDDVDATCEITNTYNPATTTIDKVVSFSDVTIAGVDVTDFSLTIDDGVNGPIAITDEVPMGDLPAGTYTVSEVYSGDPAGIVFDAVFSGSCIEIGDTGEATLVLANGDDLTCTITNIVSPAPSP